MTEAQAKAKGYQVKIGKFPFLANSKAASWASTTASSKSSPRRSTARF